MIKYQITALGKHDAIVDFVDKTSRAAAMVEARIFIDRKDVNKVTITKWDEKGERV